jgi:PPOX class probable F420-dependent enzyme
VPNLSAHEMRERVNAARVARLATVSPDGQPHLVPMTFALDGDRVYSAVDAKPKLSARLRRLTNIAAHPAVTVLVDSYDDDWTRLWWVRMDGRAEVVSEGSRFEAAIEALAAKYEAYATRSPEGPVVAIDIARWRGWTAS